MIRQLIFATVALAATLRMPARWLIEGANGY